MAYVNRILIADNSAEYGGELAKVLSGCGFVVVNVRRDGATVVSALEQEHFDFALIDDAMTGMSAVDVISACRKTSEKPYFFILTPIERPSLEAAADSFSETQLILTPFSYGKLAARLSMTRPIGCKRCQKEIIIELELLASRLLDESGMPPKIKDRKYFVKAVSLALLDPELRICVTKRLYPTVAAAFGTNGKAVERSMRHAVLRRSEITGRPLVTNSACIRALIGTIESDYKALLADLSEE